MATLKECFETDFKSGAVFNTFTLKVNNEKTFDVKVMMYQEHFSNAKFLTFYIPENDCPLDICSHLITDLPRSFAIGKDIISYVGMYGEKGLSNENLVFTGRVFFYCESEMEEKSFQQLCDEAKNLGLFIHLRGPEYVKKRNMLEKPKGFISHDTRDKDSITRPLAINLLTRMCPVWFDEYTLEVGAPLRESIEKGIKECKKVILILSPNFLNNNGWTKTEFNSIFTREIIEEKELILPIWAGVNKQEVFDYSPTLANRVGLQWTIGLDEITRKLVNTLTKD